MRFQLDPYEVHAWAGSTALCGMPALEELLSAAERSRAERFRRAPDRSLYVASHAMLRLVLGAYAGAAPRDLRLEPDALGKPQLASGQGPALTFSLSHSGDRALLAVGLDRPVGADIEEVRPALDTVALARSVLSPKELREFERTPATEQRAHFFRSWVRKEAVLKGCGLGLAVEPSAVAPIRDGGEISPGHLVCDAAGTTWCVRDLALGERYAGAIAARGRDWILRSFDFFWPGRPMQFRGSPAPERPC